MTDQVYDNARLDVIELGVQSLVADRVRNSIEWSEEYEKRWRATILAGFLRLAGQRFQSKRVEYPADWWQGVKARFFPRWALSRWPARTTVVTWSPSVVYPLIALPAEARWEILDERQSVKPSDGSGDDTLSE